ncbi:uncharacterized protein LOC123011669 [Tribolium madens]|uniref:uncharacterized protein LOC123011669 n=1 Tax=Tribolium madens TaxID=41895 RepID=UPI001CF75AC0|nr:uncharacterized protein LOC123011669 [Tribolium madens]
MLLSSVTVCLIFSLVSAQNCKTRGEWCGDTYQCCGGCCIRNTCIDTYKDCRIIDDPCLEFYCPPDEMCQLYQPRCQGCDIETLCVPAGSPDTVMWMNPETSKVTSTAPKTRFSHFPIYLTIFFLIKHIVC